MGSENDDARLFSRSAEAAIIGSMIIDPTCIDKVLEMVGVEDFGFPENEILFAAIVELYEAGKKPDGVLVRDFLEEHNQEKAAGGIDYLARILDSVPSAANAAHYAGIVCEKAARRRATTAVENMGKLLDSDRSLPETIETVQQLASGLDAAAEPKTLISTGTSEIAPEKIEWLWPNKIPTGALTIIAGDPGSGKSFLFLFLASLVSTGSQWPDGDGRAPKGSVLLIGDEDDPAKVVVPRLIAHKADRSKIEIVSGQQGEDFFSITDHLDLLDNKLKQMGDCRLVGLDPITSFLGGVNANSNAEVRAALGPLALLAAEHNTTIIAINHFNKKQGENYIYRGLGSTAFVAQARSAWGVMIDKDDRETRIFCPIKSNYCIEPTGLKFRIIDGAVQFESEPWTGHIDDAGNANTSRLEEASTWLQERLGRVQIASATIFEEGAEAGFSRNLLYRAKTSLGVQARKLGYDNDTQWFWRCSDVA